MIKVQKENLKQAIQIASVAFQENESLLWFTGSKDSKRKMEELCRYCILMAAAKNGAWLSNDGNALGLYYYSWSKSAWHIEWMITLRLIFFCTGLKRLPMVLRRQKEVNQHRGDKLHIYACLIASNHKNGNTSVIQIKNHLFELSNKYRLPIYAETSLLKNKIVYQRYGFTNYASIKIENSKTNLWFMKRNFD